MLTANAMQGQVRCFQIWSRQKKREGKHMSGPKVYAACINVLLNYIQWHLSLFKPIYFFLLISMSSPAVWITKINKCISEILFFYFIFHSN